MAFEKCAFASLLFVLLLLLSGCGKMEYAQCCGKGGLVDSETGLPLDANAHCNLSDGTFFGSCALGSIDLEGMVTNCTPSPGYCASGLPKQECLKRAGCKWDSGAGSCAIRLCSNIATESECAQSSCNWDSSNPLLPHCESPGGALPALVMPICVDDAPKSCVNDRCTAMVCGQAASSPAPPYSLNDWDAEKAMAGTGTQTSIPQKKTASSPAINLQGSSCSFETMNNRLYNQFKSSRGSLWVNSFRFGIGRSFADYEASRNFFPITDLSCSANPGGSVDRFINYLDISEGWCRQMQAGEHYYLCPNIPSEEITFTDEDLCNQYCGSAACSMLSIAGEQKYDCPEKKWAYSNNETCMAECNILPDPYACSNNEDDFPFLAEGARFKMKYVADYLTDADYVDSRSYSMSKAKKWQAICKDACKLGSGDKCEDSPGSDPYNVWNKQVGSDASHGFCRDYGQSGGEIVSGPWVSRASDFGEGIYSDGTQGTFLRNYFENHKFGTVDFDYEYYASTLRSQWAAGNPNRKFPFECESGADCYSGTCNKEQYRRDLLYTTAGFVESACPIYVKYGEADSGKKLDCIAANEDGGFTLQSKPPVSTNDPSPSQSWVNRDYLFDHEKDGVEDSTGIGRDKFLYRVQGETAANRHPFFGPGGCDITPTSTDANAYYYTIDLPARMAANGRVGRCEIASESDAPYLDIAAMGWCAGCTYSTLAVQKVDFGNDNGNAYALRDGGQAITSSDRRLRAFACYSWRGEWNYSIVDENGDAVGQRTNNGEPGYLMREGSVDATTRVIGDGDRYNGPIARGDDYDDDIYYTCSDQWKNIGTSTSGYDTMGWWYGRNIPTPSARYLKDKLMTYLQSNVMPILDVRSSWPGGETEGRSTTFGEMVYHPKDIIRDYGGEGAAIFVVADASFLERAPFYFLDSGGNPLPQCTYCGMGDLNFDGTEGDGLYDYLDVGPSYNYFETSCKNSLSNPHSYCNSGAGGQIYGSPKGACYLPTCAGQAIYRAKELAEMENKGYARPLVALAIEPMNIINGIGMTDTPYQLINGTCVGDLSNPALADPEGAGACRGTLHKFFYSNRDGASGRPNDYEWRVENGVVDKYAENFDLFLQAWEPKCGGGAFSEGRVRAEVERKMNFSKALLSNFSRPSIIWKFHFGSESASCGQLVDGKRDYSYFLSYLFNNTGAMVDAGIMGIIYDDWMTSTGQGYGEKFLPTSATDGLGVSSTAKVAFKQNTYSGLNDVIGQQSALDRGPIIVTGSNPDNTGKAKSAFCELQRYSSKVIGVIKSTFGQKLYAQDGECTCEPCTDMDYATGTCTENENNAHMPQHYCNDGTLCNAPDASDAPRFLTNPNEYRCPLSCVRNDSCDLCSESAGLNSFCVIKPTEEPAIGAIKPYAEISDEYWEFLAGLPAEEKCCLELESGTGAAQKYTYVSYKGGKERSEFLQYPSRGEEGIDCGRVPDTSVLTYCNVRIPISQKEISCVQVNG